MTEAINTFPTLQEAAEQIDKGRVPYITVRNVLTKSVGEKIYEEGDGKSFKLAVGIAEVADAHRDGILEPPLREELGKLILLADEFVGRMGEGNPYPRQVIEVREGFDPIAAITLLNAVHEHGYRSDTPTS